MNNIVVILFLFNLILRTKCQECKLTCPVEESLVCGFNINERVYKMFPSRCAMEGYTKGHGIDFVRTPLKFCIKQDFPSTRRSYGESCPVFCPSHYSPVCGASKYRDYVYRTFNNGCYLDMLNCRGDDDYTGYVEVPLQFCQRHLMKNIFKEKVLISNMFDYNDYN